MATVSAFIKNMRLAQVKSVAIYTGANFLNKGISFLLLFYFAHVLSEADFGLLNLFSNSILLFVSFISMGILQSANTEYFKLEKTAFKNFFTTTLLMPVLLTIAAILLLFLFRKPLQKAYPFSSIFILLIPVISLFNFLNGHVINMVRNNSDPLKYLIINIGRLLAEIAFAVFFISVLGYGWMGRVWGIFFSFLIVAVYAFVYFKQEGFIFGRITKQYVYDELVYSVPIIVMQISVFLMGSSAGYFIEYFTHDFATVGVFSIASTFGSIIIVLSTALLQYSFPKVYSLLSEKEINYHLLYRQFRFYAGVMLAGTILVIIITPLVYTFILKQSYLAGLSYYFFICIGYFFWAITNFLYAFMLYHKEKKKILFVSLLSILVSMLSHYGFVKYFGAYGAAVSMSVIYFIVLIITVLLVNKQLQPLFKITKA